ncbi:PhzF family phenazine biosynthesis protein [Salinimonas sp. HHU 13199]|uniref:PhzF family phenazine biosynthesis protein n=1 Tax=Salinimonas profundi TaxID=2729140 RepID=A0ABR8LU27_9ALTE|nr:PhzF family phenazine biosynthesis protein [Salinimonas profundi]MBD3587469.1 PhzF family phenazine biosynthesis protein [Salinimonas profundi]
MRFSVDTYYAFTRRGAGGNPAGVCLCDAFPDDTSMLAIAKRMGFSETVFATRFAEGFRVRYFSPAAEVAFCGHATLALGKALAKKYGDGDFALQLNNAHIDVSCTGATATLCSPPASSKPLDRDILSRYLTICQLTDKDLAISLPCGLAFAGNHHLILPLRSGSEVDKVSYDFDAAKAQMLKDNILTLVPLYVSGSEVYMRNLFAAGDVYEDPATGAAAAAISGYLRDHNVLKYNSDGYATLSFKQGDAMGQPCSLSALLSSTPDTSVHVSGEVVGPISDPVII